MSFAAWTIWIGPSIQQFIISSTLWVHIHLEAEYTDLYNTETVSRYWIASKKLVYRYKEIK